MTVQAGIYARISLDVSGNALGVKRQVEDCTAKAAALGWTISSEYVDNDLSASKNVERPEYSRLLADLESGVINAVVVYDLDRLTRKPAELEAFIDMADRLTVSLANVSGDVDLTNATGRMVARIKGAVARQEAERIGERVKRQKQQRAMEGIPHKGRYRMYGYDENWQPVEEEAAIIKEMFTRRAQGESTTALARDLNTRGITNVSGNRWTSGTLGETLTKDVYAGWVTLKGERVAPSRYPALIDDNIFKAAQTNLVNAKKGTNTRKYLLSGILVCAHCASPMKGNPSNKMYRCSTTYGGCGRLSVRIVKADPYVFHAAMDLYVETVGNAKETEVIDHTGQIESLKKELTKYQEGWQAGIYTLAEAQPKIKSIRDSITDLENQQAMQKVAMPKVQKRWLEFLKMNLDQQRLFITSQIDHVIVHPALSRGNQQFNPQRFEVVTKDGRRYRIEDEVGV